jgi:predicted DNA-binding transcriptional regulator AlpA
MSENKTIPGTCRLLRINEVLNISGLSRATLYREIALHDFPAPLRISARSVAWLQDEVLQWIESRIKLRTAGLQEDASKGRKNSRQLTARPVPARDESE